MSGTITTIENKSAAARLRNNCFEQSEAIFARAKAKGRQVTIAETRKIRELAKALKDLTTILTPEEQQDTLYVIRPRLTPKEGE